MTDSGSCASRPYVGKRLSAPRSIGRVAGRFVRGYGRVKLSRSRCTIMFQKRGFNRAGFKLMGGSDSSERGDP